MNIWHIFKSGGPVMWPLLLCSVVVLTVILERLWFWLIIDKSRNRPLLDEVLSIAETGDWKLIRKKTNDCRDYVIRMLTVGILHRNYDMAKAMEAEAQDAVKRMSKYMNILDTMITVAPLLGIFGTVLGIISSFEMLGMSGIADPKLVTGGIAQALITTATGLGISIISVFPYNYFRSRIEDAVHVMEKYSTSLEVVYDRLCQSKDMESVIKGHKDET